MIQTAAIESSLEPLQAAVLAIWRETLEIPDLRGDDDFFEVGGHSLMAVDVRMRIRELLQAPTLPVDVALAPTANAMARAILAAIGTALARPPAGAAR